MDRTITLLAATLLLAACKESRQNRTVSTSPPMAQQKPAETAVAIEPAIPACRLVTTDEVGGIQGATITDTKSSAGPSGGLIMSQCYYSAKEPNKSVSIAVIQPSAKSLSGAETRDYWASTFGRFAQGSLGSDEGKDQKLGETRAEEEKRTPPKKIDGVGEEAYWSGNRFGGALYVLKGNVILRVSVGGPDNEEAKINKSKAIAEKALERLP